MVFPIKLLASSRDVSWASRESELGNSQGSPDEVHEEAPTMISNPNRNNIWRHCKNQIFGRFALQFVSVKRREMLIFDLFAGTPYIPYRMSYADFNRL